MINMMVMIKIASKKPLPCNGQLSLLLGYLIQSFSSWTVLDFSMLFMDLDIWTCDSALGSVL